MNFSNINWPVRMCEGDPLERRAIYETLNTFKIMNGEFRDPLDSTDEETEGEPQRRKISVQLIKNSEKKTQSPKLNARNARVDMRTHSYIVSEIAALMTSSPLRRYHPAPMIFPDTSIAEFTPNKELIAIGRLEYLEALSSEWERSTRACVNTALQKTSTIFRNNIVDTNSYRLPKAYKMAAHIVWDNNEVKFKHVENVSVTGSATVVNLSKLHLVRLSKDDQNNCGKHGIYLAPAQFLSEALDCKRLLLKYKAQFAMTEDALRAMVNADNTYAIPVSVYNTDYGNLFYIEDPIINTATPSDDTHKYYELLLQRAMLKDSLSNKQNVPNENPTQSIKNTDTEERNEQVNLSNENVEQTNVNNDDDDDDDEDEKLFIVDDKQEQIEMNTEEFDSDHSVSSVDQESLPETEDIQAGASIADAQFYVNEKCTCPDKCIKYDKWSMLVENENSMDIIVRRENYLSTETGEQLKVDVLLEKWPFAGSMKVIEKTPQDLHPSCHVTGHIDIHSGSVIMYKIEEVDKNSMDKIERKATGLNSIFKTMLQLVPGDYILHHKPSHGSSIMLYMATETAVKDSVSPQQLLKEPGKTKNEVQTLPAFNEKILLPWQCRLKNAPLLFKKQLHPHRPKNNKKKKFVKHYDDVSQ